MTVFLLVLLFAGYLVFVVAVILAVLFREEKLQIDREESRKDRL